MLTNRIYKVVKFGNELVHFYDSYALALNKAKTLSMNPLVYVEIWQCYDYVDSRLVKLDSPRLVRFFN